MFRKISSFVWGHQRIKFKLGKSRGIYVVRKPRGVHRKRGIEPDPYVGCCTPSSLPVCPGRVFVVQYSAPGETIRGPATHTSPGGQHALPPPEVSRYVFVGFMVRVRVRVGAIQHREVNRKIPSSFQYRTSCELVPGGGPGWEGMFSKQKGKGG